ncbi:MAG: cobalamin-dependent protein, partial [Candidatus Altiarchaeota archaeon]|nr:cobalamin-dependent protein [Candidatus Altiarchaeota archaeon]
MIDVLLAYPSHRRVLAGRTYSPLGLLYVAAILERDGFTVRVLDFDVDNPGAERLKQILEAERPKVVGINTLTTALPEVYGLVRFFRMNSGAVIVVGGSHVTCEPSSVEYLGADYGIRGEGEYSFLTLCRRVIRGAGALESIDGLVVKDSGMKYKPPAYVPELDALPFPARHLVHVRNYMFNTVLTSRGCPFNCIFCADVSTKVRSRSPA